ncbi:MAG TPA: DUF5906 domain-containing protein, partial [Candidatus Mcinerneyibacterium sp.]|nr:DUF5906 domain-containing protein [Candidatus Mcinerneyibacterium sp.]
GYTMYTDVPIEKGIMFFGKGRNGKGKTIKIIQRFLGKKNFKNIQLQKLESEKYLIGNLMNKLANIGADIPKTGLKAVSNFKGITGGDIQTAQRKFKNPVDFFCYAKQIFSCNQLPEVYSPTPAFWNRWEFITFPYRFIPKHEMTEERKKDSRFKLQDTKIINKITTQKELNGLFNWALGGLKRLLKNQQFSNSTKSKNIKTMWLSKSNSFRGFCMKYVESVKINDQQTYIIQQELDYYYHKFCEKNNLKTVGNKSINRILEHKYSVRLMRKTLNKYDKKILGDITDSQGRAYVWKGIKYINKEKMMKELFSKEELNQYDLQKDLMTEEEAIQEIKDYLTASQKEFFYFDKVNVSKKILNKLVKDGVLYQPQNSGKYMLL